LAQYVVQLPWLAGGGHDAVRPQDDDGSGDVVEPALAGAVDVAKHHAVAWRVAVCSLADRAQDDAARIQLLQQLARLVVDPGVHSSAPGDDGKAQPDGVIKTNRVAAN